MKKKIAPAVPSTSSPVGVANEWVPQQAVLLATIVIALFSPTLRSGFVYDSEMQILTDPFIHTASNWWNILTLRVMSMDVLDFNRPVHLASLMIDAALWGVNPVGFHLSSILLHAANTVLLFLILRRLALEVGVPIAGFPAVAILWVSTLIFGVHPLVTEAVCEPSYREDLLATGFSLLALWLATGRRPLEGDPRATRQKADASGSAKRLNSVDLGVLRACGCAAACFLAVGSKESGITAVVGLIGYWALFRKFDRSVFWVVALGLSVALTAWFVFLRFHLEVVGSMIFEGRPAYPGGSFGSSMLLLPRILVLYLQNVVCPVALCADYGLPSVAHLNLVACIAGLIVLAIALGFAAWRSPLVALGCVFVVAALVPVVNFFPIYRAAADRYMVLPLAGVALIFAGCLFWIHARNRRIAMGCLAMAGVVLLAFLPMNVARQRVWANPLALWTDTFARVNISSTAASGLGGALYRNGQKLEAEEALRKAVNLTGGRHASALAMLAVVVAENGREEEAMRILAKALEVDPRFENPEGRVKALVLTRFEADAINRLLARRAEIRDSERIRLDLNGGTLLR